MKFEAIVERRALADIQQAINYYNDQQKGLGKKFEKELDKNFDRLEKFPFFQIRHGNVRCLPLKKFPFMTILQLMKIQIRSLSMLYCTLH